MQQEVLSSTQETYGGKKEPEFNQTSTSNDLLTKIMGNRWVHYHHEKAVSHTANVGKAMEQMNCFFFDKWHGKLIRGRVIYRLKEV